MSKKRNKKKPNPVYLRGVDVGLHRGIAKTSRKVVHSIEEFEQMKGVGPKMMDNIYKAFGLNRDMSDEEEEQLNKIWGRYI